jgi:hypothetical protein
MSPEMKLAVAFGVFIAMVRVNRFLSIAHDKSASSSEIYGTGPTAHSGATSGYGDVDVKTDAFGNVAPSGTASSVPELYY